MTVICLIKFATRKFYGGLLTGQIKKSDHLIGFFGGPRQNRTVITALQMRRFTIKL